MFGEDATFAGYLTGGIIDTDSLTVGYNSLSNWSGASATINLKNIIRVTEGVYIEGNPFVIEAGNDGVRMFGPPVLTFSPKVRFYDSVNVYGEMDVDGDVLVDGNIRVGTNLVESTYLNSPAGTRLRIGAGGIEEHVTIGTSGDLTVNNGYIYNQATYDLTTGNSANIYMGSNHRFARSTSARKYKKDIEPIQEKYAYNFFDNVHPVFYRPKGTTDENKNHSYYGYIADDVMPIEPRLVQYGKNGEPESFNYDRVPALLHVVLKNEIQRIDALETENQLLKNEIKIIKEMIS